MTRLIKEKKYLSLAITVLILLIALVACKATFPSEEKVDMAGLNNDTASHIDIEYLYLDLNACNPCQSTEAVLDQAVTEITPILEECGFKITVNKIHVKSEEQARELRFISSPTIRINGRDIQPEVSEKPCECCSGLCGDNEIDCRVWVYSGEEYWAPPKAMLIDAILSIAYSGSDENVDNTSYTGDIPENLKLFFNAKEASESSSNDVCCSPATSNTCCPPNTCCP